MGKGLSVIGRSKNGWPTGFCKEKHNKIVVFDKLMTLYIVDEKV